MEFIDKAGLGGPKSSSTPAQDVRARAWFGLFRSPLNRKIIGAVFLGILVIELLIFIPSYDKRKQELLNFLEHQGQALIDATFTAGAEAQAYDVSQIRRLLNVTHLVGVAIFGADGARHILVGEWPNIVSTLKPTKDIQRYLAGDGGRYEIAWPVGRSRLKGIVVLRFDSSYIAGEMAAYMLRIAGLVVIIACFLTIVTMWTLGRVVLSPLLGLRDYLIAADNDGAGMEIPKPGMVRNDELGDVYRAVDIALAKRREAEQVLKDAHDNLEHRVEERTIALRTEVAERKAAEEKLRQSEALFRAVVNHSPTKIHIKDIEGRYMLINKEAEKLFGIVGSEWHGKTTYDLFEKDIADAFTAHDKVVIESGQATEDEEEFILEDGVHTYLTTKFPIFDQGKVTAIGAIGTDITERKRVEEEILKAHDQLSLTIHERTTQLREEIEDRKAIEASLLDTLERLQRASHAKSDFLAHMSHELRTPLNAIIGFSETLIIEIFGSLRNDKQREYVADILSSGRHLLTLINDILDLSKIEARKMIMHDEAVVLAELGEECIRLMRPLAESKKVDLKFEELAEIPTLRADRRGIKQILLNLLSNAVKFTPEGGEVSLGAALEKQGTLIITVTDTGVGMDADDISEALTPFSQTDSGISNEAQGTGLGLPLANGLMEAHGGTLEIESKPGKGTTVTVRFPAERVIADPAAEEGRLGD